MSDFDDFKARKLGDPEVRAGYEGSRIRTVLADHYTPEGVEMVMRSRNTMLDGRSPNDLLDAREFDRLDEWLSWLGEGNGA